MATLSRSTIVAPIERVPPEIQVNIMGYMVDFKSLLHLFMASRIYRDASQINESAIAKEVARNIIGPDHFKLPILAETSRFVDPSDEHAVKEYLDKYVGDSEWPLSHYNMRLVASAHRVDKLMWTLSSHVRCLGFEDYRLGCATLTQTEKQRVRCILYICAIASNLFPLGAKADRSWLAPIDSRVRGRRRLAELIRRVSIEPTFLAYHRWALGIMDWERLPRIPTLAELESVLAFHPTDQQ